MHFNHALTERGTGDDDGAFTRASEIFPVLEAVKVARLAMSYP